MADLTVEQLAAIRDKARRMADGIEALPPPSLGYGYVMTNRYRRVADLRHIALDCQAAIDGCKNSMESVVEFIADDFALSAPTEEEIATAPMQTTIGMAA